MIIQYRDDSFSESLPFADLIKRFHDEIEDWADIKALHFGTWRQLEQVKAESELKKRVADLERAVKEMSPTRSDILHIPTDEQINKLGKEVCPKCGNKIDAVEVYGCWMCGYNH